MAQPVKITGDSGHHAKVHHNGSLDVNILSGCRCCGQGQEASYLLSLNCGAGDQVGDWVKIVGENTVAKVTDNSSKSLIGIIGHKATPTSTRCDVIIEGKAELFTGLDVTKEKYFLSTTGGMTVDPPYTGYIIDLGKPISTTALAVHINDSELVFDNVLNVYRVSK